MWERLDRSPGMTVSDSFSDLELFARIADAGSLSETARRLGCSLAAVSRRLATMETRLGVRLVDRGTRHFQLTDEGSLLLEGGGAILRELEQLEAHVGARSNTAFGHIRVGAPNQIGRRRFAPLLAEFSRLHSNLTVELVLTDGRVDVLGDELDVGLHIDEPTDADVVVRRLLSSRRVVCASPAYLAAHGGPACPDDLAKHDCLRLVRGRHLYDTWPMRVDERRRDVKVSGRLISSSAEVLYDWALAGRGIAFKALWDIEDDLRSGALVELLAAYSIDEMNLYATYPNRRHLPRRTRAFIDHMAEAVMRGCSRPSGVLPSPLASEDGLREVPH